MKLFISPSFTRPDAADGGIRRVCEAQKLYLPSLGIDIVNSEEEADIVAIHAGSRVDTNKPIVAHNHGLYWDEYTWENWALKLNNDVIRVLHNAQVITAPSEWVANSIRRAMWTDVTVLHHGVDIEAWRPVPAVQQGNYVLWNKTRLDAVCDVGPVEQLAERMSDQRFVSTFGNASLANLTVTGALPHDQAKALVQKAGIYLCTTRETFGIGTIEALACGVPVVGWAWGGQQEIVTHGVDGWLVEPGDFDGLAEGLRYCLANKVAMGKAARKTALQRFTWQQAIARYVPVYQAALNSVHKGPKISVIIPCYKLEKWLRQAVLSVIDNKYDDYEIVIVNDNSPDWDDELTQWCATDSHIKVVTTPKNLYLAGALNYGIEQSRGEYILCLDADNMLAPGTLRTLAGELDKYRSLDIAYGRVKFINPDGSPDTSVSGDGISQWPPESFSFMAQLQHKNQIPSTCIYRRWVWERSGGYRRRCRTAEDADFWCRATSIGAIPARVTDAVTLIYRQRTDSMSRVEKDWPWNEWYPWYNKPELTPFAAPRDDVEIASVQSYDPSVITVVIPVGPGHEEIVVDAVDSIIAQTYQKWSIIVVNDSGTDLARLPSFVKVLSTTGRCGPAVTRNVGIKQVVSPYFLPLDADDLLAPTALEDMLATIREVGGYVYSDWIVHETGEVHEAPEFNTEELGQALFHAVTCLYPTRAWTEVGGFDENISWEDWDFALSICKNGYCGTRVAKALLQYRMTAGTIREGLFADREKNIAMMRAKWPEGSLMACGSCGGGGGQQSYSSNGSSNDIPMQMQQGQVTMNPVDASDLIQLIFTTPGQGMRTYRGQITNKEYHFGSDWGENVRYVHKADAQLLLQLREFEIFTGDIGSQPQEEWVSDAVGV